jgi:NADPH2:quinone reductase
VARLGRIVVVGNRGTIEINPRGTMTKDVTIAGFVLWNASHSEKTSIHAALEAGLGNRTLRPVVGQEIALKDAPRAHQAVLEPGAYGKIVLVP